MPEQTAPFWLSWAHDDADGPFELHTPWWTTGYDAEGRRTVCAAVRAVDEDHAVAQVRSAYDRPPADVALRFCDEKPADWNPLQIPGGRFPAADWMRWEAA